MIDGADAAGLRVGVEGLEERLAVETAWVVRTRRGRQEAVLGLVGGAPAAHVPRAQPGLKATEWHRVDVAVEQAGAVELAEQGGDAAGAVDVGIFHSPELGGLAHARHGARDRVDVVQREVDVGGSWRARICSTVLVEPPMATSSVMAFSKAALVAIERGSTEASSSW